MKKRISLFACFAALSLLAPGLADAASCGDGIIQTSERCDDGNRVAGDGCNKNCNVEDGYGCVGTHPSVCAPVDVVVCGNGIVQPGEECDGGACCNDDCNLARKGSVCRGARGECDKAETCSGASSDCPADERKTTVCRAALGPCDTPERCSGDTDFCPADARKSNGSVCRPAAGGCDIAEACDGSTAACPANSVREAGDICRAAVSPECDVAEVCTGASTACPEDVLIGCPDTDGIDCVHPACGVDGECTTTDDCVEICRQPTYWGNHSGEEKGRANLTQTILDQTGPLEICGQTIDSTDLGELDSAVEALCVQREGVEQRTLFRALVATALNCAVSEGGTCDDIVSRFVDVSFTECNERCAGTAGPGSASTRECVSELFCFNRGGRSFSGECALGTCDDATGALCGDDFPACDEIGGECRPFEGNCSDARLCTDGLETEADICFAGRALPSSPQLCRDARRNQCTIDSCP